MSLKFHPDKFRGNEMEEQDAEQKFIMINKAYQTLTDESTRENFEKYGNPDGFQGSSVTIGLPSFLTRKSNELTVLLVYFFMMVTLVVIVGTWWRWSTRFHKSGVLNQSNYLFWNRLRPQLNERSCIEVLAGSDEFRELELMMEALPHEQRREMRRLNENACVRWETKDDALYTKYATTLLFAHMNPNCQVPSSLKPMMTYFLKETPKLLDVMIDMTLQRQFLKTGVTLLDLKQRVVQCRKRSDSPLSQLPYYQIYSESFDKALTKFKIRSLQDVVRMDDKQLDELLQELNMSREECENFKLGIRMIPDVHVEFCARTYDEDQILVKDIVTVTVKVQRIHRPWEFDHEQDPVMEPPEKKNNLKGRRDYREDDGLSFVDSNIENKRRMKLRNYRSPVVHTQYPFQMREKWVAIMHGQPIGQVLTKAIPALIEDETMNFTFPAQQPGKQKVILQIKCDSYFGLDVEKEIYFTVAAQPPEPEEEEDEDDDYAIPDEDEEPPQTYWYYLYGENIWEFFLTLFLLYFLYLIIISSSYGQKYVQPYVDVASNFTSPYYNEYVGPYVNMTYSKLEGVAGNFEGFFSADDVEYEDDFIERDEL